MSTASLGENVLAKGVTPFAVFVWSDCVLYLCLSHHDSDISYQRGKSLVLSRLWADLIILVGLNITDFLLTQLVVWHLPCWWCSPSTNLIFILAQLSVVFWMQSLVKNLLKSKNWSQRDQFYSSRIVMAWEIHERAVFLYAFKLGGLWFCDSV